ncbi:MAG TPA: hypothetical protein PLL09_03145 [Flavobacterium sp.]|uniref:TonB-dependent receptor plug domain-containing protein n=1 Tax=unclassified Flavobacterium TaxID=196869 RepID=UPI0025BF4423|nr:MULTISPECIES: hypothetical protein [unclassified Flavobacterium]HRE76800.1 hypothetical protein [Flavobacterium sp.]
MRLTKGMFISKLKLLFFLFFQVIIASGQESKKIKLPKEGKTVNFLRYAESGFGVYYSYADSLLYNKYLVLKDVELSLADFHLLLLNENDLQVVPVRDNLYTLINKIEKNKSIALSEVIVNGYLINSIKKDLKRTSLRSFNQEVLPGISDFDVLRAFHYLPGVKSPNQTSSGLYVKGGGPDQNLLLWNKIRVYHPGHLFGMISPVNSQIVDEALFYSSVLPTEFGSRTSSVFDLRTSRGSAANESFDFGVDMLHADLSQRVFLLNKKAGLRYTLRKSLAPLFSTPTYQSYTDKVFQNSGFSLNDEQNNFDFWDGSVVFDYSISDKTYMSLSSTYIGNNLDFSSNSPYNKGQNQTMDIENLGASLQINSDLSEKSLLSSTFQFSQYDFFYQRRIEKETRTDLFLKQNDVLDLSTDLSFRYKLSDKMSYLFGYQFTQHSIGHQIRNDNENFGFTLSERSGELFSNSLYFSSDIKKDRFDFQLGSRLTSNYTTPFLFEPRLNLTYRFSKEFQALVSFERRSQLLQQINENAAGDISLENYIWVLSDQHSIPVLFSNHFHIGFLYKKDSFVVDLDIYHKETSGITSFSNGVVFNSADLSSGLAALTGGYSRSNGLDLTLQKEISRFKFWSSYSFLNSKNKFEDINNGSYFNSNGNITHSINITSRYQFSSFFITLGWFWNSGKPYSVLDENNGLLTLNNKTLSDFHSLDFSFLYTFLDNANYKLKAGISINNLYDHRVIINKEISRLYETANDLVNPRYTISDYYSLGFTPNLFLKFSF